MLRRTPFLVLALAFPLLVVACGGSTDASAFDEPEPGSDTGTSGGDSVAVDSSSPGEDATITDTDVPPIEDTSKPPTDTGTPPTDTGTISIDTGVISLDTGTPPPKDGGVVTCTDPGGKMYLGHCYFPITPRNFANARDACLAAGAHLVSITSAGEQTLVSSVGTGERWIGLARFSGSSSFRWITSEPVTYTNWASGEPNGSGYCARLRTDGWADIGCDQSFPGVCERE